MTFRYDTIDITLTVTCTYTNFECTNVQVKIVAVEKKVNEIVNRLEKTKAERYPDLAAEKESRDREERNEKKAQLQEHKKKEKEEQKRKKEMEELRLVQSQLILQIIIMCVWTLTFEIIIYPMKRHMQNSHFGEEFLFNINFLFVCLFFYRSYTSLMKSENMKTNEVKTVLLLNMSCIKTLKLVDDQLVVITAA